jgi:hypothetical protein
MDIKYITLDEKNFKMDELHFRKGYRDLMNRNKKISDVYRELIVFIVKTGI